MALTGSDLISITDLSADDILFLCERASEMAHREQQGGRYDLSLDRPVRMAALFFEASTRTNQSFRTAITELGGVVDGFVGTASTSVSKKETIRDTIKMFEANHFDIIAMRHPTDGSVQWAADVARVPVINGGDGKNEHPTQSLLDVFTILQVHGSLENVRLGFGGDLAHGRTVRSLSLALSNFPGLVIRWAAEDFLGMPEELRVLLEERGVRVIREQSVEQVLAHSDFYYMTRPQLERMDASPAEIDRLMRAYKIDAAKLQHFKGKLMHPLPVNSEVAEIECDAFFHPSQAFYRQAENGVLMRKAILYESLKQLPQQRFEDQLDAQLFAGNNRLMRAAGKSKERMFVDRIDNGLVLDHLRSGSELDIAEDLKLIARGYDAIPANIRRKGTSFLKTDLQQLSERELKQVALRSPEPTVSVIRDGSVVEKFVYLLCQNTNCITRVLIEDVPAKFYRANGHIFCRYCRHVYEIGTENVKADEVDRFVSSLPDGIEKI